MDKKNHSAEESTVHRNFVGFQFLSKSQMIGYFVGALFPFNCPCLIT